MILSKVFLPILLIFVCLVTATSGVSGPTAAETQPVVEDTGLIESVVWAPDSQHLVLAMSRSGKSLQSNNLYALALDAPELKPITRTVEEDSFPVVSRDGRNVAFFRGPYHETNIWIMALKTHQARQLTSFRSQRLASASKQIDRAFAWGADQNLIVAESSVAGGPQFYSIDITSGARRRLTAVEQIVKESGKLLPTIEALAIDKTGERWAIFSIGSGHPQVTIINSKDSKGTTPALVVDPYPGTVSHPSWSLDNRYVYLSADIDLTVPRSRRTQEARQRSGTFRVDVNTGRIERVSSNYGEVSPDGRKLLWQELDKRYQSRFKLWLEELR